MIMQLWIRIPDEHYQFIKTRSEQFVTETRCLDDAIAGEIQYILWRAVEEKLKQERCDHALIAEAEV